MVYFDIQRVFTDQYLHGIIYSILYASWSNIQNDCYYKTILFETCFSQHYDCYELYIYNV